MNWKKNKYYFLLILLAACRSDQQAEQSALIGPTIEVNALADLLDDPSIQLIDFRKAAKFEQGHIPGAINLWRRDIEDPNHTHAGMMATAQQLETRFAKLGIKNNATLVVYDDNGSCDASRFWWVLQQYGHDNVIILNGGIAAWSGAGNQLSSKPNSLANSDFKLPVNSPQNIMSIDQASLFELLDTDAIIIDARTQEEYSGARMKNGASRAGRIPGSKHLDWKFSVLLDEDHRFKNPEALQQELDFLGADKHIPIVVYCHSGVRSAHLTFVLTQLLGYTNVKNYDGSWIQWSALAELPISQDSLITLQN
ncbi:sulfurtransferase [Gilvibacter sp.]|uniref:sulfurtransferase n=1 Tax=Gilvibacter sp. TaxID=2729997 RepID=UPI003F4A2D2A